MTKTRSTKSALISSVIALLLCFTMLLGTTFAWFTDSVTSANNIIKSGTLNVEMYYADGKLAVPADDSTDWKNAQGVALYTADQLWEPGYTDAKHIKISNEGTLALKYQLAIIPTGTVSELAEVIDVYLYEIANTDANATQVATRDDIDATMKVGTLADVISKGIVQGNLAADTDYTTTIVLKMQEGAGNEYQNKSIGDDFTIQLLATQYTAEGDSFGTDYDEDAWVTGMKVYTASDLQAAINAGETNIQLMNDINLDESIVIPASTTRAIASTVIDLNGKTITGTKGRDADNNRIHVIVNNGILTIKNGTVKSAGNDGGSAILNNAGATLTIEDVTLYGAPQSDPVYEAGVTKPYPSYAVNNYGNAVVNGATIKSYHGAIATGGDGVTVINDADIDVGLGQSTGITSYVIYSYENAQVTVNGGKFAFTKQEIYVNGGNTFCELGTNPIIINGGNYTGTSFSTGAGREYVIKGGTFDVDPSTYVATGFKAVENDGVYYVVSDEIDVVVTNPADLAAAIAQGGTVYVATDLDMNNAWTSVKPTAALTVLGNGNVITNLNLPLLAGGVSTTVTFKGLTVADSNVAPAAFENGLGTGAFVPYVDAYGNVAFEDCHLVNSTVTGNERAGGFIGYTSGQTLSFKNCTVDKCEISAVGGAAGFVAYSQTATTIDGCSVTNTKVTATEDRLGTKTALAGSVIGTVNADTVINNVTASGNTVSNNNALPAFSNEIGRKVAGVLKIDGKTVVTDASGLANGGELTLGGDVQTSTNITQDADITLNGNTLNLGGSDLKVTGNLAVSNGTVDVTNGYFDLRSTEDKEIVFENVIFNNTKKSLTYGNSTDRVEPAMEFCPEIAGVKSTIVFRNCTFNNANVALEAMSGKNGAVDVVFENCTFNNLGNSDAIEVSNYLTVNITIKDCKFNMVATSNICIVDALTSSTVTVNFEGENLVYGEAAVATDSSVAGTVDEIRVFSTQSVKVASLAVDTVNGLDTVTVSGIATK